MFSFLCKKVCCFQCRPSLCLHYKIQKCLFSSIELNAFLLRVLISKPMLIENSIWIESFINYVKQIQLIWNDLIYWAFWVIKTINCIQSHMSWCFFLLKYYRGFISAHLHIILLFCTLEISKRFRQLLKRVYHIK